MKVLIAEDNVLLGKSLKRGLEEAGWTADWGADGKEAWYFLEAGSYDVVVLDWMLPQLSGLEVLQRLRSKGNNVPVIMVTARGAVDDRVQGLDTGADDYLSKPFEMVELISRLNALYRRSVARGASTLDCGNLTLELNTLKVFIAGQPVELTGKEYDLLQALVGKAGHVVSRHAIVSLLYPFDQEPDSNSVDVLLNRLRRKLSHSDVEIATVRGKGFVLRVA